MSTPGPRRHLNARLLGSAAVFMLAVLLIHAELTLGLAYLSPAMGVFLLLALGRYPGERRLRQLLAVARPPKGRRRATMPGSPARADTRMPRGGALLASALAGRAPPGRSRSDLVSSAA